MCSFDTNSLDTCNAFGASTGQSKDYTHSQSFSAQILARNMAADDDEHTDNDDDSDDDH